MSTIREVAKEAGVSVATVSRVINGSGYAHEDTRKAVMEAVEKLQYKPNEVARSLYKRKSKLVGLILPDITNPFFPEMARGVEDTLQKEGYRLIFGNSDEKREKEMAYIETFLQNNVVGLIASTSVEANGTLNDLKIPVVLLDRTFDQFPAVYSDQNEGGRLSARVMLERGSKEIVLIRGPMEIKPVYERFTAALRELKEAGVNVNVIDSTLTIQGGQACASQLFKQFPKTDGVIACNDIVAATVIQEALKQGKKIPEDIQVIGFDNIEFTALLHPPLSTIHQPAYEMGQAAAEMLIHIINQEKIEETIKKLPISFVERQTTRKAEKP